MLLVSRSNNLYIDKLENHSTTIDLTLTCSISGTTSITYSLIQNDGNPVPSWITINPTSQKLEMNTPEVTSDTTYTFSIKSSTPSNDFVQDVYLKVVN